ELSDVDLGTTPPPGGTRVVTAAQVRRAVTAVGLDARKLSIPNVTRVKSAARRLEPNQLEQEIEPRVSEQPKAGVVVQRLEVRRAVTIAPRATVGTVYMPRIPRRQGVHQLTATVGIMTDGEETQRVPVSISVQVNAAGALPDVARGAEITLTIARGS